MDEKQLRKYAGLNESEEVLTETPDANGMLGDMRDIDEEFKRDRKRVRDILRLMIKTDRKESEITESFLADLLGTIFADQERGKKDRLGD